LIVRHLTILILSILGKRLDLPSLVTIKSAVAREDLPGYKALLEKSKFNSRLGGF
jgi:hypothetical protein